MSIRFPLAFLALISVAACTDPAVPSTTPAIDASTAGSPAAPPLLAACANEITGTDGDDVITGTPGADCIRGGDGDDLLVGDPSPTSSFSIILSTPKEASRFLALATFGGSMKDINSATGRSAAEILQEEMSKPMSLYLPRVEPLTPSDDSSNNDVADEQFWNGMIQNDDQLRTRMTFALSQIFAINSRQPGAVAPRRAAFHMDQVAQNALGNYRDLLEDMTYSPLMGNWLTYIRNRKADPSRGRIPDQNYAREIMQLFTIGLVELNMDGTPVLDASGNEIETYTAQDVAGLSRVFTGLSAKGSNFFNGADQDAGYSRLVMFDQFHSDLEKSFLGETIPAGTQGEASISMALDILFEHPNVPPFVARQLIQRFTMSNPPPDYVERVAVAFADGQFTAVDGTAFGTGERGDLSATIAAILLDPLVFDSNARSADSYGKVREPVLNFVHYVRAFNTAQIDASNEFLLNNSTNPANSLGQQAFKSPSVFNFYRPGYIPPATEAGDRGMTVPEFQLVNDSNAVGYLNFMSRFVFNASPGPQFSSTFEPDYSDALALADDPEALADYLNTLLSGGRMEAVTRQDLIETLASYPIDDRNPDSDRFRRVALAIMVAINAPSYRIQR